MRAASLCIALLSITGMGHGAPIRDAGKRRHVLWHSARGILKWAKKLDGIGLLSPGVSDDGTVYVGAVIAGITNGQVEGRAIRSNEGNLFAVAPNGKLKWTYHPQLGVGSQPVVGRDGTVYFDEGSNLDDNGMTIHTVSGGLDAVTARGALRWIAGGGWEAGTSGVPLLGADGTLYVWSGTGISANRPDGKCLWTVEQSSAPWGETFLSQFAVSKGRLYAANRSYLFSIAMDGTMRVAVSFLNLAKGPHIQGRDTHVGQPMVGPKGAVYLTFTTESNMNQDARGTLWVFAPSGAYRQLMSWNGERSEPVMCPNGTILINSSHGLLAFRTDGSRKWSLLLPGNVTDPLIAVDGTIYVGSSDHFLYAIGRNGSVKWKFKTGGEISAPPAVGPEGTVYVAARDGKLYAIR